MSRISSTHQGRYHHERHSRNDRREFVRNRVAGQNGHLQVRTHAHERHQCRAEERDRVACMTTICYQ